MGYGPWPSCGVSGCLAPALFKVEMTEGGAPITVWLCPFCIKEIKECMATIAEVREKDQALLDEKIHNIDLEE